MAGAEKFVTPRPPAQKNFGGVRKSFGWWRGKNSKNFVFLKKQHELERRIQSAAKPLEEPSKKKEESRHTEFRMTKSYFRRTVSEVNSGLNS